MGSYYVLEVGNFDPGRSPSPLSAAGTELIQSDRELDQAGMEQCHSARSIDSGPMAVPGEGGYFMLNTNDPSLSEDDGNVYSYVPQTRLTNYVNVLKQGVVSVSPKVTTGKASPKLHPHLIMAGGEDMDKTGQSGFGSIQSEGRASMYENVCPPGEREILPTPAAAVGMAPESAESANLDGRSMYENISLKPRPSPDPSSTHNHVECPEVKRSVQQRQNAYETIKLGSRTVNGGEGSGNRHSNCQSPDNGTGHVIV